ncbi:P52 family lipoprotein (plasmid) [Borreliella spielmanii]|uniref:Outer membrane protein n=1 Tax=Borreliella spielmanii A14S TaxID=498742 RepID=C0RBL9_9SPIR|nr:P52 family lipoprotein [Borreliella spielmanii]ACN53129.1 outer membrane protein [Borreliella spielmanii A14S]
MRILVGVCIITLALLGCYLPDKQKQAVQTFFENLEMESYDKGSNEIVTGGIFSNLKLYVSEHCLLVDIKKTLYGLKYGSGGRDVPPVPDYNEEYFNKFFLDLGSERSKELIKLFGRVKNDRNDKFKRDVYWLYSCISELYSLDIKYSGEVEYNYYYNGREVFMPRPTIDQQYLKVKEVIEQ